MEIKNISQLIEEQYERYDKLEKLQKFFEENPTAQQLDISARKEMLSKRYKKFCEVNSEINRMVQQLQIETSYEKYFVESLPIQCELLCLSVKGNLSKEQPASETIPKKKQLKAEPKEKLPIDILKFSGKFREWLRFENVFSSRIHSNPDLNNAQKLKYLKSALPKELLEVFNDLFASNDGTNYNEAWKKVTSLCNNRDFIDRVLKELLCQPNLNGSNESISQFLKMTKIYLNELRDIGVNTDNWDVLLVHVFVQKLDEVTETEWNELQSCSETPELTKFFNFLQMKIKKPTNKSSTNCNPKNLRTSYKVTCICCGEDHRLWNCEKFVSFSVEQRQKFANENVLCVRCLSKKHTALDCWKSYNCIICNKNTHHFLLHKSKFQSS